MKVFLVGFGIVVMLMAGYVGYLKITYIDDTVTDGSGYGFDIGDNKEEIFATLQKLYADKQISLDYNPYSKDQPAYQQLDFEKDIPLFYEENSWMFYFGHKDNIIRFRFEKEKLVEIYRHRQFLELL